MFFTHNHMLAPAVSYRFHLKDAHMFYCESDNTMNFSMDDDSHLEISGIEPRQMFVTARNALASNDPILNHFTPKSWDIESAKEMITKLQAFVDKHTPKEDDQ